MDSVDYFANGTNKCVVATEDADQSRLKPLLLARGFVEDDLEIASYAGCSKTDAAVVLGKFIKDKTQHLSLVVHRDRDYLADDPATKFNTVLRAAGLHPFLTELNDVESYFINAAHLHHVNPVDEARVQAIIDEATTECRDESLRTAGEFQKLRGSGKTPDHGQIALDAARDYDANPAHLRRGDIVIGRVTAKLQAEMKANPRVFVVSPHLNCPLLKQIASQTWPPASSTTHDGIHRSGTDWRVHSSCGYDRSFNTVSTRRRVPHSSRDRSRTAVRFSLLIARDKKKKGGNRPGCFEV